MTARRALLVGGLLVLTGWLLAGGGGGPVARPAGKAGAHADGAALWRGDRPLVARIAGHATALPAQATRCVNCHGQADVSTIPVLTPRHLHQPQVRRGGPPTRYDAATFCRLLRTGLDPAAVLLPRAMPRYEIDDADCTALWRHLTQGGTRS